MDNAKWTYVEIKFTISSPAYHGLQNCLITPPSHQNHNVQQWWLTAEDYSVIKSVPHSALSRIDDVIDTLYFSRYYLEMYISLPLFLSLSRPELRSKQFYIDSDAMTYFTQYLFFCVLYEWQNDLKAKRTFFNFFQY